MPSSKIKMTGSRYLSLALLFVLCLSVAAQKRKAKPAAQPEPEACKLGSPHKCACPRMVARTRAKVIDACEKTSKSEAQYLDCLSKMPSECQIVSTVDPEHPEDSCKSACKKDICRCHDGPACTHFEYDYGASVEQH